MGETTDPRVVLASASPARAAMLRGAGVEISIHPASVDEGMIKSLVKAQGAGPAAIATALAEAKARKVSDRFPESLVIGADQVMEFEGVAYDKAPDLTEARRHLLELRGKAHQQISAVCVARAGEAVWRETGTAKVHVRQFSLAFLERYIKEAGRDVLSSVGCYQLEGLGAQLIERIEGDCFTIQGLPLFPLLTFLRREAVLPT